MLEPHVMKVTRTVLRRGGESNLSNLSDNSYGYLSNNLFFIEEYIPSNKAIVFNLKITSHHPSIDWN
jgi:hypothetical protein